MTVEATKNLLTAGLAVLVLTCAAIAVVTLLRRRRLLPLKRLSRRVTWGAPEIILAFLAMVLIQSAVLVLLDYSWFFRWLYGWEVVPVDGPVSIRSSLWATVLSTPFVLGAVLLILWAARRTPPRLVGAWSWRWPENVAIGFWFWVLLTPFVFGIHYGAHLLHEDVFGFRRQLHPLEQIFRGDATPVEWTLLVLQAVVMAPLLEELLFRGLLLPWLAKGSFRSAAAWLIALVLALLRFDPANAIESLIPAVFVVVFGVVGALATIGETGPEWRWRAILSTSMLFAMLHAEAWPAPVPLFLLAIGLGWLAQRTRSLVGPVTLHALFNVVSTIMLLRGIDF